MSEEFYFMDGNYVPSSEAKIPVRCHAFLYGTSVFEGIRGYWNEQDNQLYVFRMKEHIERMFNSAKIMFMDAKYSLDEYLDIFGKSKMQGLLKDYLAESSKSWDNLDKISDKEKCRVFHCWRSSSLVFGMEEFSRICTKIEDDMLNNVAIAKVLNIIRFIIYGLCQFLVTVIVDVS